MTRRNLSSFASQSEIPGDDRVGVAGGESELEVRDSVAVDVALDQPVRAARVHRAKLAGSAGERGRADEAERIVGAAGDGVDRMEVDPVARGEVRDGVGRRRGRLGNIVIIESIVA